MMMSINKVFAAFFLFEVTWRTMEEIPTGMRLWSNSSSHTDTRSSSRMPTLYANNLQYILKRREEYKHSSPTYHQF
jgi:hypothetical protein